MMATYLDELKKFPQLKHEELVALFTQLEDPATGPGTKKRITDKLTVSNLRLVVSIAKMFRNNGLPLEDLIQEGNIGLMKAISRFDHSRGYRFSTYATRWIRQAIGQFVLKQKRVVRLPAHAAALQRKMIQETARFKDENACEPTEEELRELTGASSTVMKATVNASFGIVSLQDFCKRGGGAGGNDPKTYENTIKDDGPHANPFANVSVEQAKEALREVLKTQCSERETNIVRLRFSLLPGMDEQHEYQITEGELEQIEGGEGLT